MQLNKLKNSNEVCDAIYKKESDQFNELLDNYLAELAEDEDRGAISRYDLK